MFSPGGPAGTCGGGWGGWGPRKHREPESLPVLFTRAMIRTIGCLGHCPMQPSVVGLVVVGSHLVLEGLEGSEGGGTFLRAKVLDGPGTGHQEVLPGLPLTGPDPTDQVAHEGADGGRVTEAPPPWPDSASPGDTQAPEPAQGVDTFEGEATRLVLDHPGAHPPPSQAPDEPSPGTSHHSCYGQSSQITNYCPGLWLAVRTRSIWSSGCHCVGCPH